MLAVEATLTTVAHFQQHRASILDLHSATVSAICIQSLPFLILKDQGEVHDRNSYKSHFSQYSLFYN